MKRTHLFAVALSIPLAFTLPAGAKKPKKPPAQQPQDSGNSMTFTPEDTGQPPAANAPPPSDSPPPQQQPSRPSRRASKPAAPKSSAPPPVAGQASKTLDRAIKLYESEDYYSSTIELNKVVEGQSGDDEGNKQRAEFYMGKALFQLKYYSASLSYFSRIVEKGPSHAYYDKTLQWLASLSQYLPDSAGVLDKIGAYTKEDLEKPVLEPVRDQLFFLLGRFHYTKGTADDFQQAVQLFQAVPETSEFYARAKFFEGMTHIRAGADAQNPQDKFKEFQPASEAFKAVLRKAIENPDKHITEYENLANLQLARTFYAIRNFKTAAKYYDKVPMNTADGPPALFESSWALYQMDGDSKALGNIHTLNSPYFENELYPESLILKAVIYFERCNFKESQGAIDEFNATYPALKKELDTVINKYPDNAEFYAYVLKIRNGEAGLSDRVQRAATGALSDKNLVKAIEYVSELDRELKALDRADPTWKSTAIANTVLQDLTLQKSYAANAAGNLARERLKRLSTEIQELVKQAIKVEYQTLDKKKGELQAQINGGSGENGGKGRHGGDVVVDDEHEKWPFDGEYWLDELGSYRFQVSDKCKSKQ